MPSKLCRQGFEASRPIRGVSHGLVKFKMPETLDRRVFEAHRGVDFRLSFIVIFRLDSDGEPTLPRQPHHHSIHDDVENSDEQRD